MLRLHKQTADLSTSVLSQGVLEIYSKSGMYDHHAKQMKDIYYHRMIQLRESVRSWLPVEYRRSIEFAGGVFVAISLSGFNTASWHRAHTGARNWRRYWNYSRRIRTCQTTSKKYYNTINLGLKQYETYLPVSLMIVNKDMTWISVLPCSRIFVNCYSDLPLVPRYALPLLVLSWTVS